MVEFQNRIMSLVNSGQLQEARQVCSSACNENPKNAQLWFMLSAICGQSQDFAAAEKYSLKALEIDDSVPTAHYNLAVAQRRQGKISEASDSLERAIHLQPDFVAAIYELGNISLAKEDYSVAIDFYRKVLEHAADTFQAYTGIAVAYEFLGEHESAITACLESLRINASQQDVVLRLAGLYDKIGSVELAIQYCDRALASGYTGVDVYVNLARMQAVTGNYAAAENSYKKALAIDAESVEALTNLAMLYDEQGETTRALQYIKQAQQLSSDDERINYNYAKVLSSLRQYSDAEKLYEKILQSNPDFTEAAVNLGNLYLLSGKADKAQDVYELACTSKPDFHDACSNMLMSLNYTNRYPDVTVRDKHFAWANQIEENVVRLDNAAPVKGDSTKVRIGYVSPDFRNHSVAYFFECILKYSDKQKVITYCYSDVKRKDEVTERFSGYCDQWRDVVNLENDALASMIKQDEIDILVDLCGHISGNRLPVFALKPAAIQITYLGYPHTTGLSAMDYRIIDKITDPEGSEDMMSEKPLYIAPCFLAYTPYASSPAVSELPALKNSYITFGSFNNLAKMTDEVIELWSKILRQIPGSKLCIKARQYADQGIRQSHIKRFKNAGIDERRLDLLSYSDTTAEHLATYNKIDIALDTFPYNGTTTTFEALWMGVPVIGLSGSSHAARVGASILNALGETELLADSQQQYLTIACELAKDIDKLSVLRRDLREKMAKSALLDSKMFVKKFESILYSLKDQVAS